MSTSAFDRFEASPVTDHGHRVDARAAGDAAQVPPAGLDVSVVVPTYGRPDLLATCLAALCAQDFAAGRYEIIVCDDGPDAATHACVAHAAAQHAARGLAVRYLPVTRTQGPAGARNAGWQAARAPLVAFTDDDTRPDRGWLAAGAAALRHGAAAAAGTIVVPLPARPTDYEADASGLARAEFATANVFVARCFLAATGGFDERFTAAWREDSDLQFSLLRAGGEIVRAPDAVVVHPVRPARWGVSIAQQRKSQFDALLYRKHPALYRARIGARPPLHYYAILAAALAAGGAALAGAAAAALALLALWFALTARFCLMRLRGRDRSWRHIAEMAWTSVPIPFLSVYWRLYGAVRFKVFFL
ncbi:glycosyltransferase family 2 protein [Burkholderia glumae]|uniref:glycosyltransferase family 2 protein n=1 Tax=Burkholderia glumae TaxID=337 RepID=UPI00157AA7BA|nr:glycosyltransferase [Burkholderia glumae]MCM2547990.1 glycosyltransferase family 2 protein [Burkholderia glumae]MCR1765884.1 glycosyltransferase [Burkholderia glumae]NVE21371.1 glycosyltransferase [Burkholderia glumae]QKM47314.1 Putative mycofactocin biosynthesis glycosyltransferase MftF [Burkholderia glumae]